MQRKGDTARSGRADARREPKGGLESLRAAERAEAVGHLLDRVPGAWFLTRRDGTFAYISRGACATLGYRRSQLLGMSVFDIDPTLTEETWRRRFLAGRPGQTRTSRTTHRRKDGSEYPIEIRSLLVQLEGEVLAVSYSVDRTESERAHADLRATRSRLARLIRNLPDLVFRLQLVPKLQLDFASPACLALLGYEPRQLEADPEALWRVLPPDQRSWLARAAAEPETTARVRFVHASGRSVWMDVRASRVESARGEIHLEGVARDVSPSHEADLANRKLKSAIEHSAEAVVVTDERGRIEYVNPAHGRASGLPSDQSVGRAWADLEVGQDDGFLLHLRDVLEQGAVWQGRVRARRSSGERYDGEATLSPIRDPVGTLVGSVAVMRDITERLQLEAQLRQAQKMEAVGRLAGGIAHDFNNLLHVIQGHTRILQMQDLTRADARAEVAEMLAEVDRASCRAASLVRQLLVFSREGAPEAAPLDFDEVLQSLRGALQSVLGPTIQLVLRIEARRAAVLGNAAQLEQVITHLCINARDASSAGGFVRVTLDEPPERELPSLLRQRGAGHYVRLRVQDDGAGISRQAQHRLYEPFFTTKERSPGAGLGLATAYAVVQQHGGLLDFCTDPSAGSTFRVFLPRCNEPVAPRASRASREGALGEGRLALVAEDEPAVRALTARYLAEAGFEVLQASSGPAAQGLLEKHGAAIAVAVLDAVMPIFGGEEVARQMRERGLNAPVLFVTGYDAEVPAVASPAVASSPRATVLRKPFGPSELLSEVARLLRARG